MAVGFGKAKTIFFGEHFVVYGCKAIGFGLDKKIEVDVKRSSGFEIGFDADQNLKKSLEVIKNNLGPRQFKVNILKSEIPVACGLGSSAALNVAIIRALSCEFGLKLTNERICDLAFEAEKIFHGTPSGIDNTLATFGGAIVFQKRLKKNLVEDLRVGSPLHLVMIDSGVRSKTISMVDKVRAFKEKNEAIFSNILNLESLIVDLAMVSIKKGETGRLGSLMNANHGLLNAIGATHIENEKIVSIARENGALGAKIVGAGGGGFCMALMDNEESARKLAAITNKRYQSFYSSISANQD